MSEVTRILSAVEAGEPLAVERLLPLVYEELRMLAARRMAAERPDHTLQATALVHEAYVRLVGSGQSWQNRRHFFAAAANCMRQILVDHARASKAQKRGGDAVQIELEGMAAPAGIDPDLILDLDAALTALAEEDHETAELVKLRLFAGLSVTEAGRTLDLSRTTAYESWAFARAWFAVRGSLLSSD